MEIYIKPVGPIGTNCYIISEEGGGCAMVDPGAQPEKLIGFLDAKGLKPEYILLTHGHYDHIGGVKAIAQKYGAKIVISEQDAEQLTDRSKSLASARFPAGEDPYLMEADLMLKDGDTVRTGDLEFTAILTPGHTKGDITYRCGGVLFTGDTLFAGDCGRTDLRGGSWEEILVSLGRLGKLEGNFHVLPGHGGTSDLDTERKINPYLKQGMELK